MSRKWIGFLAGACLISSVSVWAQQQDQGTYADGFMKGYEEGKAAAQQNLPPAPKVLTDAYCIVDKDIARDFSVVETVYRINVFSDGTKTDHRYMLGCGRACAVALEACTKKAKRSIRVSSLDIPQVEEGNSSKAMSVDAGSWATDVITTESSSGLSTL